MRTRRSRRGGSRCGTPAGRSGLVLTRQKLPVLDRTTLGSAADTARGAYVLADAQSGARPELILIATGSEVSLALEAHRQLSGEGVRSRVVSMPSWELFEAQPKEYRDSVLPLERDGARERGGRVAVRMGAVRRSDRRDHRRRPLRRLGARSRGDEAIRLHGRARDGGGETSAREPDY